MRELAAWIEAQKLPEGHYERKRALDELNAVMAKSRAQEAEFSKKTEFSVIYLDGAAVLVSNICNMLHTSPPKKIICNAKIQPGAVAEYRFDDQSIYLACRQPFKIVYLLHELAHHVAYIEGVRGANAHGEGFLWVEALLFEAALVQLNGCTSAGV